MKKKQIIAILLLIICMNVVTGTNILAASTTYNDKTYISKTKSEKINKIIRKGIKKGDIPGMSLVILKDGEEVFKKCYGYADIAKKEKVSFDTCFEVGSVTKAYTGLAILKLADEKKIDLQDNISKYIPWFKMQFEGKYQGKKYNEKVDIPIKCFLYQTSGIPFSSICDIPEESADDALEKTAKAIVKRKLDFYPGQYFEYATVNYDMLALVIEKVTGMTYEEYMKKEVLEPLGLRESYFRGEQVNNMATGYKYEFFAQREYIAPEYRGNVAAGYCITNINDLEKWIRIQLGLEEISSKWKELIEKSHQADRTVAPQPDGSSYASGWNVYQSQDERFLHGGNNPNYYSFITCVKGEKFGVGILANTDSEYIPYIGKGIQSIIFDEENNTDVVDMFLTADKFSTILSLVLFTLSVIAFIKIIKICIELAKGKRKWKSNKKHFVIASIIMLLVWLGVAFCIYVAPERLFGGITWIFLYVWASRSLFLAVILIEVFAIMLGLYYLLNKYTYKENNDVLFLVAVLSSLSGFANALLILIINLSLAREEEDLLKLAWYFGLALLIYIMGQKIVRTELANISNRLVLHKREKIITKLLRMSFDELEKIEDGKIQVVLNDDTEAVSECSSIAVNAITNVITMTCCIVYLGIVNLQGVLMSIGILLVVASSYYWLGKVSGQAWEEARSCKDFFIKLVNSMLHGFKELKINSQKRIDFEADITENCQVYCGKKLKGDIVFTSMFIFGELMFTLVIGAVGFVFPFLFKEMDKATLGTYIFVFLYMTGPINMLLSAIPKLLQVRISWRRINEFLTQVENVVPEDSAYCSSRNATLISDNEGLEIEMSQVQFRYKNADGDNFEVGPINATFHSGESVFITGGNGSGKSTIVKLLLGIYPCDSGKVLVNGKEVGMQELRDNYAVVFSDFYMFDKLYGIHADNLEEKATEYLKLLKLEEKVKIEDGKFNTTKLSTGQRKRLALVISFLEEKAVYVFDEWAADQDPEFRKIFYETILPGLKAKNKCVVAITHDDRYFHMADRVIKIENGLIQQN